MFSFNFLSDSISISDDDILRLAQNYRNMFMRLALFYFNDSPDDQKEIQIMDKMEDVMPRNIVKISYEVKYDILKLYEWGEDSTNITIYSNELIKELLPQLPSIKLDDQDYNPIKIIFHCYIYLKQYKNAQHVIDSYLKRKGITDEERRIINNLKKEINT